MGCSARPTRPAAGARRPHHPGWHRVDLCRRLHDHLRYRHVTLAAIDSAHGDCRRRARHHRLCSPRRLDERHLRPAVDHPGATRAHGHRDRSIRPPAQRLSQRRNALPCHSRAHGADGDERRRDTHRRARASSAIGEGRRVCDRLRGRRIPVRGHDAAGRHLAHRRHRLSELARLVRDGRHPCKHHRYPCSAGVHPAEQTNWSETCGKGFAALANAQRARFTLKCRDAP